MSTLPAVPKPLPGEALADERAALSAAGEGRQPESMGPSLDDALARTSADWCVAYFECVASFDPDEIWSKGLATAKEWQRLIRADLVSSAEVSALLDVVHANRHASSGWADLACGVHEWARCRGVPVPPFEVFFRPDSDAP